MGDQDKHDYSLSGTNVPKKKKRRKQPCVAQHRKTGKHKKCGK